MFVDRTGGEKVRKIASCGPHGALEVTVRALACPLSKMATIVGFGYVCTDYGTENQL